MKKRLGVVMCCFVMGLWMTLPAFAQEMSNLELMQEIKALKNRLMDLESQLKSAKATSGVPSQQIQGQSGETALAERVRKIEEKIKSAPQTDSWADRITLSGVIEAEAGYENMKHDALGVKDEDSSDIVLATVELGIDVDIAKHVKGHVLLLWEEDDTEPMDVDEAAITLDGADVLPLYLNVGRLYVPFGNFDSHFISDPMTLELGETRESAVQAGFANDWADISLSAFNGDIDETDDDDHIKGFVGNATFTLPEDTVDGLGLCMGFSYISSIADSDGLEGEIVNGSVADYVAGMGAFVSASFLDKFFFEAEYLGALDEFEAGELSFDGDQEFQPTTWNVEFAMAVSEALEAAVKCEGGEDLGDFLPEIQYGVAVSYGLLDNTTLALEYLYGEFENDDKRDLVTAQLAIAF